MRGVSRSEWLGNARTDFSVGTRVSTRDQHLVEQFHQLRQLAQARGYRVVRVYRERKSAAKERSEHRALMADAAMRRFDVVLCWSIDRFGRSLIELLSNVEVLESRGVMFISLREPAIDTSTAAGKLILAVLAADAEFEGNRLRERTREGLARVRRLGSKSGKPIGRAPLPLDLAAIRVRLERGEAIAVVARDLGCPSARFDADSHGCRQGCLDARRTRYQSFARRSFIKANASPMICSVNAR